MLCYQDMAFCEDADQCAHTPCHRRLTPDEQARAAAMVLPIAWMPMRKHCESYVPKEAA